MRALRCLLCLLAAPAAAAPPDGGAPPPLARDDGPAVRTFDRPDEALAQLIALGPRVIGFGEYHQTNATKSVRSSLARFTDELLPLVAPRASDLVVETWITGDCGAKEEKVVKQVERTTDRPPETESELVKLLRLAKERGVQPHILTVSCQDYKALLDEHGKVDFERLLKLVNQLLERQVLELAPRAPAGKLVCVYGGALHNDLQPEPSLAPFTYGADVARATDGRYLEVDTFVPELIERDREMRKQPWFGEWKRAARSARGKTVLIRRATASYILVYPRS
jgi:hypothetical protein